MIKKQNIVIWSDNEFLEMDIWAKDGRHWTLGREERLQQSKDPLLSVATPSLGPTVLLQQ